MRKWNRILKELENEVDYCVCCEKRLVTWPRVCERCQDKEQQAYLFSYFFGLGYAGWDIDEDTGNENKWCDVTCKRCGMILNISLKCGYCGGIKVVKEEELDFWEQENRIENIYQILENGV